MGASKREFMEQRESEHQLVNTSETVFKSLLNKAYNSKHQNPFKDPEFNKFAREELRAYGYGLVEASKDIHVTAHPFDNEEEVKQFNELKKKI